MSHHQSPQSSFGSSFGSSGSAGLELQRIVTLNEEIKKIVRIACAINIMAINAILTARRAGKAASGFSVLSNELRTFTGKLEHNMTQLRASMGDAASAVSAMLKHTRLTRALHRAHQESSQRREDTGMQAVLTRREQSAAQQEARLREVQAGLSRTLSEAHQLADRGRILARNAKIEAVYGGPYRPALSQVASDFEETVEKVILSLAVFNQHNLSEPQP